MSKKIKIKDLINENFTGTMMGGVISQSPWDKDAMSLSRIVKEKYGEVDELVVPMSVSNPAAYKAMLNKQIAKNVKVKTALGNKDHKDHGKAKSLLKRFMDRFKKND